MRLVVTEPNSARNLREFPWIGRAGRLPNTRELSVPSLPYLIVYEVAPDVVTVLAIFHGARDLAQAMRERRQP